MFDYRRRRRFAYIEVRQVHQYYVTMETVEAIYIVMLLRTTTSQLLMKSLDADFMLIILPVCESGNESSILLILYYKL